MFHVQTSPNAGLEMVFSFSFFPFLSISLKEHEGWQLALQVLVHDFLVISLLIHLNISVSNIIITGVYPPSSLQKSFKIIDMNGVDIKSSATF